MEYKKYPGSRMGVGLMIVNQEKKVFVGQRSDNPRNPFTVLSHEAWQMPQGGIDPYEEPLQAAFREMKEEIGCNKAEVIAETKEWYSYILPVDLRNKLWEGRFHSQRQKWFLLRFLGEDKDININTPRPEFKEWKWVDFNQLPDLIVPFKKEAYINVMQEFSWYFEEKN